MPLWPRLAVSNELAACNTLATSSKRHCGGAQLPPLRGAVSRICTTVHASSCGRFSGSKPPSRSRQKRLTHNTAQPPLHAAAAMTSMDEHAAATASMNAAAAATASCDDDAKDELPRGTRRVVPRPGPRRDQHADLAPRYRYARVKDASDTDAIRDTLDAEPVAWLPGFLRMPAARRLKGSRAVRGPPRLRDGRGVGLRGARARL